MAGLPRRTSSANEGHRVTIGSRPQNKALNLLFSADLICIDTQNCGKIDKFVSSRAFLDVNHSRHVPRTLINKGEQAPWSKNKNVSDLRFRVSFL